jgi:hypothetical protein
MLTVVKAGSGGIVIIGEASGNDHRSLSLAPFDP